MYKAWIYSPALQEKERGRERERERDIGVRKAMDGQHWLVTDRSPLSAFGILKDSLM
jgi:hypothetical protein